MKKQFKAVDGDITLSIPERFEEITLGQLIDLQAPGNNLVDEVAILSHVPKDDLYNIRNISDLASLTPAIEELTAKILMDYDSSAMPKRITVGLTEKKTIEISEDLGIRPAGAFIAADQAINAEMEKAREQYGDDWEEHFKPSGDTLLTVLANFLYCEVTGLPWTEKGVNSFKHVVRWVPAYQALPIAKCFFLPYLNCASLTLSYWNKAKIIEQNRRELRNLRRSAG